MREGPAGEGDDGCYGGGGEELEQDFGADEACGTGDDDFHGDSSEPGFWGFSGFRRGLGR